MVRRRKSYAAWLYYSSVGIAVKAVEHPLPKKKKEKKAKKKYAMGSGYRGCPSLVLCKGGDVD